jgi:hypothetical protein
VHGVVEGNAYVVRHPREGGDDTIGKPVEKSFFKYARIIGNEEEIIKKRRRGGCH